MSDLTGLIEIAQIITGFECDRMCSLVHEYEYIQPATVKTVYEDMGVRWTPIVESDVLRILQGEKPQYFMHWDSWVNTYRRNHRVSTSLLNQSNFEFVYGGETKDFVSLADLAEYPIARELHLFSLFMSAGWACPAEQTYFYRSEEWSRLAVATRYLDGHKCNTCGSKGMELHVHHNAPIKSAYSRSFCDNFVPWKLSVLCKKCHDEFHKNRYRCVLSNDFHFASKNEMTSNKMLMKKFWQWYHGNGHCKFCNPR